jgi:hypothetical protein
MFQRQKMNCRNIQMRLYLVFEWMKMPQEYSYEIVASFRMEWSCHSGLWNHSNEIVASFRIEWRCHNGLWKHSNEIVSCFWMEWRYHSGLQMRLYLVFEWMKMPQWIVKTYKWNSLNDFCLQLEFTIWIPNQPCFIVLEMFFTSFTSIEFLIKSITLSTYDSSKSSCEYNQLSSLFLLIDFVILLNRFGLLLFHNYLICFCERRR